MQFRQLSASFTTNNSTVSLNESPPRKDPQPKPTFNVILLGDSGVGKTSLAHRYTMNQFNTNTGTTVGLSALFKELKLGDEEIRLAIWDTAGEEVFRHAITPQFYMSIDAVIFVYDVTRLQTFESLAEWMEECSAQGVGNNIPGVLVANKCDLKDQLQVPEVLAHKFALTHDLQVVHTSAKETGDWASVKVIFGAIARKIKSTKQLEDVYVEKGLKLFAQQHKKKKSICYSLLCGCFR